MKNKKIEFQIVDPYDFYIPPRFASMEEWTEYQKNHEHKEFVQTETWKGNQVTYSKWKCASLDCGAEFGTVKTETKERPFSVLKPSAE